MDLSKEIAFIRDPRSLTALTAVGISAATMFGVSPDKQDMAMKLLASMWGLAAIYIGGLSYQGGKAVEGTVPDGAKSVNDSTVTHVVTQELAAVAQLVPAPLTQVSPVKSALVALIVGLTLMFGVSGCTTSAQFRAAATVVVPDLAKSASTYVANDKSLDNLTTADRVAKILRFKSDVASISTVSRPELGAAWADVEPFYLAYVDADAALDPDEKALRHEVAARLDKLIADDGKRPFAQFLVPSTQPK